MNRQLEKELVAFVRAQYEIESIPTVWLRTHYQMADPPLRSETLVDDRTGITPESLASFHENIRADIDTLEAAGAFTEDPSGGGIASLLPFGIPDHSDEVLIWKAMGIRFLQALQFDWPSYLPSEIDFEALHRKLMHGNPRAADFEWADRCINRAEAQYLPPTSEKTEIKHLTLEDGTELTVYIKPDPGYQLAAQIERTEERRKQGNQISSDRRTAHTKKLFPAAFGVLAVLTDGDIQGKIKAWKKSKRPETDPNYTVLFARRDIDTGESKGVCYSIKQIENQFKEWKDHHPHLELDLLGCSDKTVIARLHAKGFTTLKVIASVQVNDLIEQVGIRTQQAADIHAKAKNIVEDPIPWFEKFAK